MVFVFSPCWVGDVIVTAKQRKAKARRGREEKKKWDTLGSWGGIRIRIRIRIRTQSLAWVLYAV